MLNISLTRLMTNHWRAVLLGTASVTLTACVGTKKPADSSSSAPTNSSVAPSSSSVPATPSSIAASSSSILASSSIPASSSTPASSSSIAPPPSSSSIAPSSSSIMSSSSVAMSDVPNLLSSDGTFTNGKGNFAGFFNGTIAPTVSFANQEADFSTSTVHPEIWHIQLQHPVSVGANQEYTLCFDAKAQVGGTEIVYDLDKDADPDMSVAYNNLTGEADGAQRTRSLTTNYTTFKETFNATETDATARLIFNIGQSGANVQLDNIGLYAGGECGNPGEQGTPNSSAATSSSVAPPPSQPEAWSIEKIDCSFNDGYTGEAIVLFDGSGSFDGSFFNKTFSDPEFNNLERDNNSADYRLANNTIKDGTCGWDVHQGTWLKKLVHDNGINQHSNGWSRTGFANGKTIGDIDSIILDVRVNSALTDIPSKQDLLNQLVPTITTEQVNQLDNGKFNFAITLGNPDASGTEIRAEAYLEIDQDLYRDEWVRITIPKNSLYFWRDANWQKTPVSINDANTTVPSRIALNPETKGNGAAPTHGYTVRDFYGYSKWGTTPPNPKPEEDFKEMNISIRTFEVRFDPTPKDPVPPNSSSAASSSSAPIVSSSSVASSSSAPSGPTDAQRIAAGKELFDNGDVKCGGCHGADGRSGFGGPIIEGVMDGDKKCDRCEVDYEAIRSVIETGTGIMGACAPVGNCASQLADYVWGELNGKPLPGSNNGGSSSAPSAGGDFSENFDNISGSNLPAGLEFADCDGGSASYEVTNGALEVRSGNQGCGGWVKLKSLESKSSAYVKFDATQIQAGSGNKWFMLVGNGDNDALSVESMRMRIFNSNNLIWNVGNFGDTLAPEPFTPAGEATTAKFAPGDTACFELFYDNQAEVIKIWKDGNALSGLEMGSSSNSTYQDRWYREYTNFKPDVKHVHLGGGGSSGMVMSFDNIVVSSSPIGCN